MITEKLDLRIKGEVTFRYADGSIKKYKNAIQDGAKQILALLLRDDLAQGSISAIELWNAGVLIATSLITNKVSGGLNITEFDAVFDNASFSSHIDEARLQSAGAGYFSIVTGIDIQKDNTTALMVSWTIQIINCA